MAPLLWGCSSSPCFWVACSSYHPCVVAGRFLCFPGTCRPGLPSIRAGRPAEHPIPHTPGGDGETAVEDAPSTKTVSPVRADPGRERASSTSKPPVFLPLTPSGLRLGRQRLEPSSGRNHALPQISPQCDQQPASYRDDPDLAHPFRAVSESFIKPLRDRAVRLVA
jgi:hypothetical protein